MRLDLDEELTALKEGTFAFAKQRIRPQARTWEEAQKIDPSALEEGHGLGFAGLGVGPSFGGAAEDDAAVPSALTNAVVLEELAWADLGYALALFAPMLAVVPVALNGSDELKKELLPSLVGDAFPRATGAFIEPSRTYDMATLSSRATRTPDGVTVTGKKTLVPGAADADVIVVSARARSADGASAIEPYLLRTKGATGLTRGNRCDVIGPRAVGMFDVSLEGVSMRAVSTRAGVAYAPLVERALVGTAAAAVGVARAATEYAAEYARERRAFGRAIAQNQSIAFMLAEAAMDVEAARWMTLKAAWRIDGARATGDSALPEASRAARFASELVFRAADQCVQILGGHGVIRDHLAELFFRNARALARTVGWFIV